VVYKAFDTVEGTEVAWNQVRISDLMAVQDVDKEERDRLFAEIRVLKALKHKNIMSFYDWWYDPASRHVNFITELFTSGTLRQYRKRHKHVDDEVLKRWAWQILCGLVYLHGHNPPIIHRDLKCDNIFINGSDGVVKIGDLGLATMLRARTAPQSVLGTPEFMAPELYEEEYDDRVDVYSFGMCLLELATMEYPYAECKNAAQIYRKVTLGVRPAGLQAIACRRLAEFVNTCIAPRDSRPRARQLLKHPYFDSIRQTLAPSKSEASLVAAVAAEGLLPHDGGAAMSRAASGTGESLAGLPPAQHHPYAPGPPSASSSSASLAGGYLSRTTSALEGMLPPAAERGSPGDGAALAAAAAASPTWGPPEPPPASPRRPPSRPPSAPASPPRSPAAPLGAAAGGSPAGSEDGACVCSDADRRFAVVGKYREDRDKLSLRLRICDPDGSARTVQFEFDVAVDTAVAVASEMVSDLELSMDDARAIAGAIAQEVTALAERLPDGEASSALVETAAALQQGLQQGAAEVEAAAAAAGDGAPGPGPPAAAEPAAAPALRPLRPDAPQAPHHAPLFPATTAATVSLISPSRDRGSSESLHSEASGTSLQSVHSMASARSSPALTTAPAGPGAARPPPPQRLVRANSVGGVLPPGAPPPRLPLRAAKGHAAALRSPVAQARRRAPLPPLPPSPFDHRALLCRRPRRALPHRRHRPPQLALQRRALPRLGPPLAAGLPALGEAHPHPAAARQPPRPGRGAVRHRHAAPAAAAPAGRRRRARARRLAQQPARAVGRRHGRRRGRGAAARAGRAAPALWGAAAAAAAAVPQRVAGPVGAAGRRGGGGGHGALLPGGQHPLLPRPLPRAVHQRRRRRVKRRAGGRLRPDRRAQGFLLQG
jgi:WNK lysine deficient protein kinase